MDSEEGDRRVAKAAEKAHKLASDTVQETVGRLIMEVGPNTANGAYVGCMTASGALLPTCMLFAKRPSLTPEEVEEKGREVAMGLVSEETVLFAALAASRIITEMEPSGACTSQFGPHVLWEALSMWEKIYPDKKADDFLDPKMLAAARKFGEKSVIPFTELLKKRAAAFPTSKTLN